MAKIVVCLDGTDQYKTQDNPTNVAKIFDALGGAVVDAQNGSYETTAPDNTVLGKYLPGVGTQGNVILKALGAAFGDGIAEPIIRGYTYLSRSYQPGDEIHIVGFSRGATAARALAGFVVGKGLLNTAKYNPAVKDDGYKRGIAAWYQYRLPKPDLAQQVRLTVIGDTIGDDIPALQADDVLAPPQIQAVGVFDTVSSLGLPYLDSDGDAKFDFSICDTTLSPNVLNGFHALSADESRDLFSPTYWAARANVIQVIFPGSHSNVGGGYPEAGLSDGALLWMLDKLSGAGCPCTMANIKPVPAPNPLDIARDDGATFPFNNTPRRPRAFPQTAAVSGALATRIDQLTEVLPNPKPQPYKPVGTYADGAAL